MVSRSTLLLATATLTLGSAASANAEGLYLGADLGHPQYSNSINGIGGADNGDSGGIGAKLYGGYTLTPNFALEGSVFRLGRSTMGDATANTSGIALDGVGNYTVAPQWSVLGRLGVAEGHFSTSFGNDSSSALKMGAGVQYDLNSQLALRLQYERYHFFDAFESKPNVGEFTVGFKIGF